MSQPGGRHGGVPGWRGPAEVPCAWLSRCAVLLKEPLHLQRRHAACRAEGGRGGNVGCVGGVSGPVVVMVSVGVEGPGGAGGGGGGRGRARAGAGHCGKQVCRAAGAWPGNDAPLTSACCCDGLPVLLVLHITRGKHACRGGRRPSAARASCSGGCKPHAGRHATRQAGGYGAVPTPMRLALQRLVALAWHRGGG